MRRKVLIGVVGSGNASLAGIILAREVGRLLAERGWVVVCGGLGGIMDAAAQGCYDAGGDVVGILPGTSTDNASAYVTIPVVTDLGHARNVVIAHTAAALIAIEGEYGTLSEIAIGLKLGRPVVALRCPFKLPDVSSAETARQAVDFVYTALKESSFI